MFDACPTNGIDQPNGQWPKRSPSQTSVDTFDPLKSEHQTSYLLRFMIALAGKVDD